jgi:hypothetical protein
MSGVKSEDSSSHVFKQSNEIDKNLKILASLLVSIEIQNLFNEIISKLKYDMSLDGHVVDIHIIPEDPYNPSTHISACSSLYSLVR